MLRILVAGGVALTLLTASDQVVVVLRLVLEMPALGLALIVSTLVIAGWAIVSWAR